MSGSWGGDLVVNPIVFITNPQIGTVINGGVLSVSVTTFTSVS